MPAYKSKQNCYGNISCIPGRAFEIWMLFIQADNDSGAFRMNEVTALMSDDDDQSSCQEFSRSR